MVPRAEWALVLAAFALAVPLWRLKSHSLGRGDVVEEPITLVPEDNGKLACKRDRPVGRYVCAYGTMDHRRDVGGDAGHVIAPYMTTERALYLIPGLFEQPEVAAFVSRRVEGTRFTARCKLRLVEVVSDYELRFRDDTPWGKGQPAWVAEPLSCTVANN
jgi:hypothetical protein